MRISHLALSLTTALAFACGGGGESNNGGSNNTGAACPFTFPEPTETFAPAASPALLTFATFPDAQVNEIGTEGRSPQYIVEVPHTYLNSDGGTDSSATITYSQNLQGAAILFTPDEVAAEYDRLADNDIQLLEATTSSATLTLGGEEVNVLVSKADSEIIMTIFLPIDGGDFIVPIRLGVYAGAAGCQATLEETYEAVKASVALNTATTYGELEAVIEAKAAKSE